MPDTPQPPQPLPRRLDRMALERVLARAAELHAASGEPEETISEAQIIELGKEVGLSPEHMRQALAEERARVVVAPEPPGLGFRAFGPARVMARRPIPGAPRAVLAVLDDWMQREECLQPKRHMGERVLWEPRRDLIASARRVFNLGGRGYALTRAGEVSAVVAALDEYRSLVTLQADLTTARGALGGQTAFATVGGIVTAGILGVLGVVTAVAVVPAVAAPAAALYVGREVHQRALARVHLALEQVLDRLERGETERPPGLLGAIAAATGSGPLPRRR